MPEEERAVAKEDQPAAVSTSGTDDEPELYKADDFRMYCMKVLPCSKRFCHDWTVCPYSHPGEKAKRRDPRLFSYTGIACPNMKKDQSCARGDACPYAHNVFEYWLHPTRYRTQLCNDGEKCSRKICFFAHTLEELRVPANKPFVPPEALAAATTTATLAAARKADGSNKAGLQVLSALLKAQPGADDDLMKALQAQLASAQTVQEQQALVDSLATLLQSCGFVQDSNFGRKSFDGVKAHAAPVMQRDDRLDLSASGKSRSDPARSRALRAGGARGRGRHSIDLGHDLKRAMAQQTIHGDASLPTLKSIVEALASNKDFLQQQEQQQHFSLEELAAFSAGMAAAADAAAQAMPFDDMQLQQQQQLLAAAAGNSYGSEWAGVDPGLLQSLQSVIAAQQQQQPQQQGSIGAEHLPLNWNRRRGSASMPAGGGNAGYSMEAAAAARARAALSGDPWLGDSAAQGAAAGNRARYGGGDWAEGAPGAGLPGTGAAAHPGTGLYSAFSEPPLRASQFRKDFWAEVPGGMDMSGSGMYGNRYDMRRVSTDSRRSSDSNYMSGGITGGGHEYMPHCMPIDEYGLSVRGSMDSMRYSMDSMRSAGSPSRTPHGGAPQSMGGFTDYRGSSLFAFSGPFTSGAVTQSSTGAKGSGHGAKADAEMTGYGRGGESSAGVDGADGGHSRA
ncbi:g4745 [Coccomyxa elongata]